MDTNYSPQVVQQPARRRRRLLLWVFLALLAFVVSTLTTIGAWPSAPDVPQVVSAGRTPGDGGLRAAFPAMNVRSSNPSTPERVALGRLLYFDPVLSGDNAQSCATCHHPDLGLSDGRGLAMGVGGKGLGAERVGGAVVRRGSPTVWNAVFAHRLFWDGRAADLEDQAKFPITSPDEMAQNPDELVKELKAIPEYVRLFDAAFGGREGSAVTFDHTANAIATFERTLVSNNSPFDRYVAGETGALTATWRARRAHSRRPSGAG